VNAQELKALAKDLRRRLRLSPTYRVFRRLRRCGVQPEQLHALELFGCDGKNHTIDIASLVGSLEIWDIEPGVEAELKRLFPQAQVKITDSYREIHHTPNTYDLVVVDNVPDVAFNHFEHFDLFPSIFRVLNDPAILLINVIPNMIKGQRHPQAAERLRERQRFYQAADPAQLSFSEIEQTYRRWAEQSGWQVEQLFFERRWTFPSELDVVYYAVLKLSRQPETVGA
jgi:hypothetical protein